MECDTNSIINFVRRNVEAQYTFRRHTINILPDQLVSLYGCCLSEIMTCLVDLQLGLLHLQWDVSRPGTPLSPSVWLRIRLAVVISVQGSLPPRNPLHSIPTVRWCWISSDSGWSGTLPIHCIVAPTALVGLILSICSRPNFLPSQSFILSHAAKVALPVLLVPRVRHWFTPLHVLLSLARKRSRLYAQIETIIGVVSATSRYF